jgi:uncharacterized protein (DUF433 family)
MNARSIVRDPAVLGGRWCFEDTSIAVAEVRLDFQSVDGRDPQKYRYLTLSSEEIASALAFDFPPTRQTTVQLLYAGLVIECECGEDTPSSVVAANTAEVGCVCGREWTVVVTVFPKSLGKVNSGSMAASS